MNYRNYWIADGLHNKFYVYRNIDMMRKGVKPLHICFSKQEATDYVDNILGYTARKFGDRISDFGYSDVQVPSFVRLVNIRMPNGDVWRTELEPWEEPTEEIAAMLEQEAAEWMGTAEVVKNYLDYKEGHSTND